MTNQRLSGATTQQGDGVVGREVLARLAQLDDWSQYREHHWEGTFSQYLEIVLKDPRPLRSAFQRLYDMILSFGATEYTQHRQKRIHYHFFDDPVGSGEDALFGLDLHLMSLVNIFKSAARRYGTERRIILLHGPVGSAKSTIVRLLKKGLEYYTRQPEGALYSFSWLLPDGNLAPCPLNEEPLKLLPEKVRQAFLKEINQGKREDEQVWVEGDLCPVCRFYFKQFVKEASGDWEKVLAEKIRVRRVIFNEKDRVGIGTFQPKDEKNQDSTELTGDIDYRLIAIYGSDSDPRAFRFDGEFCVANRGLIEFIEMLKLDVAFLYDLLGASQEHTIKPKKFAQTDIDEVIIAHTNEPEYRKLQRNEYMEALRDRTIKVDIPYVLKVSDEVKIYSKFFNPSRVKGKHIAPHTLEVAAMWAILTRLEDPKKFQVSLLQKMKLYDGRALPGFTEDHILELRDEAPREGMFGISPRYVMDKISNALVSEESPSCINPFVVLKELDDGLDHYSLISNEDQRRRYRDLLSLVRQEYDEMIKNEVRRAITADEEALKRVFQNYIENVKAYVRGEKVRNRLTGEPEEPDERLMRSIEEKIDIPVSRKDDFRREIMNYIASLALEGKTFDYKSNERLLRALELKLFEDQKDSIRLGSLVTGAVDRETQEKIDVIKTRLIRDYGYCETCATDILTYVASIFARGDIKEREESRR
ncbi:MAG: serine protein kinase [Armatimonadetes bacterium]|nr:serine protein kinase [Armatimonadota bacterium]MDW8121321.1 serine protein kinase [Armatimonadota bacterium]